ncbi:MAG: hypothetical protein CVV51_11855 [Spirochaetae bacterium HGW-Spirochaetae-7]|nr:MAG: hypothetical protein CVV51_11855 [Spirochaetae bacterium HGW-Spirochaetae-7]
MSLPAAFSLLVSLALALPVTVAGQGVGTTRTVIIDIGVPEPYSFNEARISARNGISGLARLYGTNLDGERVLLFETRAGWTDELVATWYCSPDLVSLAFDGFDGDGLAVGSTVHMRATRPDAAMLSRLGFPFRQTPFGEPRPSIAAAELVSASEALPESVARVALAELFMPGRHAAPLVLLAGWAVVVIASAPWLAAGGRRKWVVVVGCAVVAVAGFAYFLGTGPAELYSAGVPATSPEAGTPGPVWPMNVADHGTWRAVSWGEAEGLYFVAVRSPLAAAVPVSAFSGYSMIRFAKVPLVVVAPDGRAALAPSRLAMAWALDD